MCPRLAIAMTALSLAASLGATPLVAAEAHAFQVNVCPDEPLGELSCQSGACQSGAEVADHFCPSSYAERMRGWVVQADALALFRTSGRNRSLVVAAGSGESVLRTSDLDLGWEVGPRLFLSHRTRSDYGWELGYCGLQHWTATAAVEDANNLDLPGSLVGVAQDFTAADLFTINYTSRLHNAEANLFCERGTWSALIGARYLRLDDDLTLTATDSDSGTSDYRVEASSDLIGGQFGLRTGRIRGRWGWDLTIKTGLYGSILSQEQLLRDNNNTFVLREASARAGSAAFLGDLQIAGFYELNEVWALRGGYSLMYMAGVALAPDQLDFENLADSGQSVRRGDSFLHGASLGLEARW